MNEVKFSWASAQFCDVKKKFTPNPLKKGMDARIDIKFFTVVRKVLHNNFAISLVFTTFWL